MPKGATASKNSRRGNLVLRREPPCQSYEDALPCFAGMVEVLLEIAADLETKGLWPPPQKTTEPNNMTADERIA